MGVRIGEISSRFELMNWTESSEDRIRRIFLGQDEALRFLQSQLTSVEAFSLVRGWAAGLGMNHPTDRGFMTLLAAAITSGEVWVTEQARDTSRLGKGGGGDKPPAPPPPGPKPGPKPKPKPEAELVVTVKDLAGKPVEGVVVTAGALGTRTTGKDGVADFGKVTPGVYDVSAAKPGHGKTRNGPEEKDEKKAVSVPDGSKTKVDLIQHPECANVAFFEGSKTRANFFGFDHKTNLKATGGNSYWDPVPDKGTLTLPGDKLTRDEARWVSVAVGQETELEINYAFKGTECIPCLANSTFEILPAKVAEVVTAKINAKQAVFKIKGLAKGEASLKVICDGKDIGWFHIWCDEEKTLLVDVGTIVTARADAAAYDIGALADYMNDILRQMLIKLDLRDLGTIDLTGNAVATRGENLQYKPGKLFQEDCSGDACETGLKLIDKAARSSVGARKVGVLPRKGARRLYFYVPKIGAQWGGMNITIGHAATFIFFTDLPQAYNTGAHELGHSLKLRHPNDPSGAAQFAAHNRVTLNTAAPVYAATNTEPASVANPAHGNIMANDPTNLMGYWPFKADRKYLRYHQWKAADRS